MVDKRKKDETGEAEELSVEKIDEEIAPKFGQEMKIAILNAPVLTADGNYAYFRIPIESARILINSMDFSSYVGHESTVDIISELLHKPIGISRKELKQKVGQMALVFKLKKRPPEGKILNREEVEEIGYDFFIMYRTR